MNHIFCYETVNGHSILAEEVQHGTLTYLKNPFRLENIEGNRYEVFQLRPKLVEYSVAIFKRKIPIIDSVKYVYLNLVKSRLRGELDSSRDLIHALGEYLGYSQRNPVNN